MNEYMNQALQLAREAANEGEVPVGCRGCKRWYCNCNREEIGVNKEKSPMPRRNRGN